MSGLDNLIGASPVGSRKPGQILVVVAMAMLGLLVTAGIATDTGLLLMRKAQLDRAVDAAALAGAPVVSNAVSDANERGVEVLAGNGMGVVANTTTACGVNTDPVTKLKFYYLNAGDNYCGAEEPGTLPGAVRYVAVARWAAPMVFMQLVGVTSINLTSTAKAEYLNTVDAFTSGNDQGLIQTSNLELFGPGQQTSFGDPYTPVWDGSGKNGWYDELNGKYTYRIAIPTDFQIQYDSLRVELLDPVTGNTATLPSKIYQTTGGSTTSGITCPGQQDPCLISTTIGSTTDPTNPFWFVRMDEYRDKGGNPPYNQTNNTRTMFRLYYFTQKTTGGLTPVDLAYYIGKKDDPSQNRPSQGSWTAAQTAAQAQSEALATMLQWVSPGVPAAERMPFFCATGGACPAPLNNGVSVQYNTPAEPATVTEDCNAIDNANGSGNSLTLPMLGSYPSGVSPTPVSAPSTPCSGNGDFVVDLSTEAPDIYADPNTGVEHIYLDVIGMDGASENNWALWAGPARSNFVANSNGYTMVDAPADVNARQLYILREKNSPSPAVPKIVHSSAGVVAYGVGHLPMNSDTSSRVRFPLAYLGPEFAGLKLKIQLFDADSGTVSPVIFYFDTIPQNDWQACYTSGSANCATDQGGPTGGSLGPDQLGNNNAWGTYQFVIPSEASGIPFYGGRLYVYYQGGNTDTFGWKLTVDARPSLVN